jgi:hypothetical protein
VSIKKVSTKTLIAGCDGIVDGCEDDQEFSFQVKTSKIVASPLKNSMEYPIKNHALS